MIELMFIPLLILANGVFAMSEMAVVSARKVRLRQRAKDGDKRARAALELAQTPGRFLSTVQVGISLVAVLTGTLGGAAISGELAARLDTIPFLAPYSETISVIIVVLAITYFSLVIGELLPKQIALSNPERIASLVAPPMTLMAKIASPVVYLLNASTKLLMRILRVRPSSDPPVTEDEVRARFDGQAPDGKVVLKDRIADSMFQQVLTRPDEYSVVATPNLNGDYLSDACAAMVGGLGMAPGANIGDEVAIFEATHGSAPKYAGQDKVNPGSMILSGAMMLDYLGWGEAAGFIEEALEQTIQAKTVTYDLHRQMDGATLLSCSQFGEAVVGNMGKVRTGRG